MGMNMRRMGDLEGSLRALGRACEIEGVPTSGPYRDHALQAWVAYGNALSEAERQVGQVTSIALLLVV